MYSIPLSQTLTGLSVRLLALCCAAALAFLAVRRLRPGSKALPALRVAAWLALPTSALAAVNLLHRLARCKFNHPLTFPFYANPYCKQGTGLLEAIRAMAAQPGTLPWLGVAVLAGAVVVAVAVLSLRAKTRRAAAAAIAALLVAGFGFALALACIPDGLRDDPERGTRSSLVSPWTDEGSTMLLAVPYMRLGSKRYLWEYRQLQRRMEGQFIIHAVSHPPLGSLVVRWIGRQAGARVRDRHHVRETEQQIRYALGQTVVSMFNLVLVFAFGAALFGRRAGLLAAALWTVAPTVSSYATFAPDMNYALVFHLVLLLAWKVSAEPSLRRALALWGAPLGAALAVLSLMTYSWCIVAAFAAAFAAWDGFARGRPLRDVAARVAVPIAVFFLVAGFLVIRYRIDYLGNYLYSSRYVSGWYPHPRFVDKVVALLGGQLEWLFMAGPAACSCFLLSLREERRDPEGAPFVRFAAAFFAIYALPVLLGPACLKHEVARCWVWILPVPLAFAARFLARRGSPAECAAVVGSSAAVSAILSCFLYFGA